MFDYKNKKVLVTGGAGMIGIELVMQLYDLGAKVTVADIKTGNDLSNYNTCKELCKNKDYVFHLVGVKGSPKMTRERPIDFMAPMLQCDVNMILAAQHSNIERFLYTSSIAVENPQTDVYPAWAKMTSEKLIEAMKIQYPQGTKYCTVRPANVYGKYDNFNNPNAMVITSLISKALKGNFEVWGTGEEERDFINAKDVAYGMLLALKEMPDRPVNLCSGKGVKISDIVSIIEKHTNTKAIYNNKPVGDKRRVMKLNWDFRPTIGIEKGLEEIIKWKTM